VTFAARASCLQLHVPRWNRDL